MKTIARNTLFGITVFLALITGVVFYGNKKNENTAIKIGVILPLTGNLAYWICS